MKPAADLQKDAAPLERGVTALREAVSFPWLDPETRLVHAIQVTIEVARRDLLLGSNVHTPCGLRLDFLPHPELSSARITCALCREGEWLSPLIALLPPRADQPLDQLS